MVNLTSLGVSRPVLITVVNLLIIIAGTAAIMGVDVRELPNVDRPVVSVRTNLPGASPETMDAEVTSIIEGAVARVPGVKHLDAASEENNSRVHVTFQSGIDLNNAANDVREAVSRIQGDLPDALDPIRIVKADDDAVPIVQLAVYSDTLSKEELAKRVEKDIEPEILTIEGVADVTLEGYQPRELRVIVDPARLASNKVSMQQVITTLRNAQFDVPAGSYKSDSQQLIVRAYATITNPERIEQLHVRENIRIEDIGEVFYAPREASSFSLLNGRMVIGVSVVRQAGSNTIAIANAVDERLKRINERARDYRVVKTSDDSIYIKGALKDVVFTLLFAIFIVLLVIALFLGQWRAVLIPAVTMPVSLIGTLAAIWLFGFSINLLTLLALVLATGLIVDDAIVVLENIQRRRSQGLEPMAAAVVGTRQVFFAVIATTVTLVSVFLPIAFLPGDTGRLFREFGLVLAIAVCISSFVALSLCPMMASRLPDHHSSNRVIQVLSRIMRNAGSTLSSFYFATLKIMLARPWLSLFMWLGVAAAGGLTFQQLDQELLPTEDRGALNILLTGPDGASINYADKQSQLVEKSLEPYLQSGIITDIYTTVGRWDPHRAFINATLKPWDERDVSQQELTTEINNKLKDLPGANVRIWSGNSLGVRGAGSGLDLALLGSDYGEILESAKLLAKELEARIDDINDINVKFDTSQPELYFDIDRERANDLGVAMSSISDTLKVLVDQMEVTTMNINDQSIPVMLRSSQAAINDPEDLLNVFVVNDAGTLVPLNSLINIREAGVAAQLDRHAQSRAIEMDIGVVPGAPLGNIIKQIRQVADEVLPAGSNILFTGEAATINETSHEVAITFVLAILVVFLVLAAQFESAGSALIVIFTVPFGLAAAVFALMLSGQSVNLYSQIGFVMLVGIITKNAILLIEFMDQLRDQGKQVYDAIIEGVQVRLRPVMMTVLSTVLGSLPLILSEGPGAEARNAIGWIVFGGVGLSALFTLYLAPLGYSLIAPHIKPRAHASEILQQQLDKVEQHSV